MAIFPAYDFDTFKTQGASNGSGVELSDTYEDFQKKTNGIINHINTNLLSVFAHGLIKWERVAGQIKISTANLFNIASVDWTRDGDLGVNTFTLNFETDGLSLNYYPFATYGSVTTINPDWGTGASEGRTDSGTPVYYSPTVSSIKLAPYYQDNPSAGVTRGRYSNLSVVIFQKGVV